MNQDEKLYVLRERTQALYHKAMLFNESMGKLNSEYNFLQDEITHEFKNKKFNELEKKRSNKRIV